MKHNLKTCPIQGNFPTLSQKALLMKIEQFLEWQEKFIEELQQRYAKLCETRVSNIKDDAVAFFIEELLDAEPDEILGENQQ